jgi:peroxiredoxin
MALDKNLLKTGVVLVVVAVAGYFYGVSTYGTHVESDAHHRTVDLTGEQFDPAIPFTLPGLQGESISLSDFAGKWVLLNIWADWCAPCVAEMPSIQRLSHNFADRQFAVLALHSGERDPAALTEFMENYDLTFPVVIDADQSIVNRYQATGLPTSYLISPDGKVVAYAKGGREWDSEDVMKYLIATMEEYESIRLAKPVPANPA